ncbi:endonuclease/exonuclease/phosphatase family protein [Actinocrispum sp. NPDC049592]|uniref:endonuclease/exonuclease/phosphatase family protein n=1 Tax=Actinocrispum sp. NPDC049592 TaxID=3154835 RepID=UPI00341FE453
MTTTDSAERPRVWRWTGRALLAVLALWLVATSVNQLITGDYWFGGIPNPLPPLLFFAGPPLVLAALVLLALSRTRLSRMDRQLLGGSIALVLLVSLHLLLSGRTWLWVLPDLMPPLLFVLMPVALLVILAVLWVRRSLRTRRVGVAAAVLTTAALVLGAGQSGINAAAFTGGVTDGPAPPGALHIVSWDTLQWDSGADGFFEFLTERRADVYLLQSYAHSGPETGELVRDADRLRREFPGYRFATIGGLLTISRFPIVAQVPLETNPVQPPGTQNIWFLAGWRFGALRTDLDVNGRILSVYNAFFYDRYFLHVMPLTPAFFADIRGLAEGRRQQVDRLLADVRANPHPVIIAGNLNLLPNTGDRDGFDGFKDAGRADRSLYPVSLTFFGLPLWRMDWTFTSPGIGIHSYDLVSPHGLSSRHLQDVVVSLHSK